jgi:hypothetical protein
MGELPLNATSEQVRIAQESWARQYSQTGIPPEAIEDLGNGRYVLNQKKLPRNHRLNAPPSPELVHFLDLMQDWRARSVGSKVSFYQSEIFIFLTDLQNLYIFFRQ